MSEYNANAFGSLSLHSRLATLFRSQSALLDDLLAKPLSESNRHITPLLGAIRENCKATLLLEREGLLNELVLIQRLFVQRIINCCYLLNAEKNEIDNYLSRPIATKSDTLQDVSADALLEFSNTYNHRESASPFSLSLKEQVEAVAKSTGAPKELFFVSIASVFPKSSEVLAGSLYGTAFQFGIFRSRAREVKQNGDGLSKSSEEFCTTLFMGIGLLDALFKIVAKRESIESIVEKSVENSNSAKQLTQSSIDGSLQTLSLVDGTWERLESMEASAAATISKQLERFVQPFQDAYEAGVIVPTLKTNSPAGIDLRSAALMLKRVLNDLRGVWVLLSKGYTSQAASVAASLHESALATICLTLSKKNVDEFLVDQNGEIPWPLMEMAKMVIRAEGKTPPSKEYENGWRGLYAHYVWLCQIKHAAHSSVIHDASASSVDGRGYVVMAIPNTREEDTGVKAGIAIKSLLRTLECIEAFAKALGFGNKIPNECQFAERVQRARKQGWEAFEPFTKSPSPISIARSWFVKKYPPIR